MKENKPNTPNVPADLPVARGAKALGIFLPAVILCVGFMIGLCWFLRPAVSETEKRELTPFPSFTLDDVQSGAFTDGVSVWYADTFPGREALIGAYQSIEACFGIRSEQIQIGGGGDDVPTGSMGDTPTSNRPDSGGEGGETVGNYYISGNTAYELYAFNDAGARRYAALLNQAAASLGDRATVYDMVIPLHYSYALGADLQDELNLPNAGEVTSYLYSGMHDAVHTVDAHSALMAHRDEYLYFRTDHHWTATGAYYAYEAFCRRAGITPTPLTSYERLAFEGFLGTLYAQAERPAALRKEPDTVYAYVPQGTNAMVTHTKSGDTVSTYSVVNRDTDTWYNAATKYNCFIAGDNPLIEIHNEHIASDRRGTSILLVKESFGNAFAPFLVDSYEYVYIIDYRYYDGTLANFVTEKDVDDVLFLNNIVATTAGVRLTEMERFVGSKQ